ncbi:hypothetical protein H2200_009257 [Cladophialophora chaetospira]|uniref:Uncharacterized protein n=1 Tax=Cladophialophora chaetospira TaxID=386627 RepID=A0AA39CFE0_9EURO|nr:hypothetical protein H2200_009257 [Cladophialophora chaetospira]
MPFKQLPSDFLIHTFPTASDFEAFLDREHLTTGGCYIKLAKKASGIPSITAPQAVEVCLCFGWIDGGGGGTIDDKWWLGRYTPRRPKSMWSKKNTETVARLTQEGKVRPAGLAAVEAAKADGRWDRAYDRPTDITVPDDLARALKAVPAAGAFFDALNKSDRYSVLHRIQTTSPKARTTRLGAIVNMLAGGLVPGKAAKAQSKLKKVVGVKKTIDKRATTGTKKSYIRQTAPAPKRRPAQGSTSVAEPQPKVPASEPRRPGLRPRG